MLDEQQENLTRNETEGKGNLQFDALRGSTGSRLNSQRKGLESCNREGA